MKKLLLSLIAFSAIGLSSPAKTLTFDIKPETLGRSETKYVETAFDFTVSDVTFSTNNINPSNGQVRGNQGNDTSFNTKNFYLSNTTELPNISKIELTVTNVNADNTYLNTGSEQVTANTLDGIKGTLTDGVLTFTLDGSQSYFRIGFVRGGTSNTAYLKTVTITYDEALDDREKATLAWSETDVCTELGTEFQAPTLSVDPEGALSEVVYDSSNPEVAEISADGVVSIIAAGTTEITASITGSATYQYTKTVYTLTVITETFTLLTDASTLSDGDRIIIANTEYGKALGTAQSASYRSAVDAPFVNETAIGATEDTQIITIKKQTVNDETRWNLQVDNGLYLYASSSSSNELKSGSLEAAGTDANAVIEAYTDGTAVIMFNGDHTRNLLRYNSTDNRFSCYGSNTQQKEISIFISKASLTPDTREDVTLTWSESEASAEVGSAFTAPTLTANPTEALSEVTYTSSNPEVATIDTNGTVTIIAAGTTEITASISNSENYKDATISYTLTVTDQSAPIETEATFDFVVHGAYGMTTLKGSTTAYEEQIKSISENGVTLDFEGNYRHWTSSGTYELRTYTGALLRFTAPKGFGIASIDFLPGTNSDFDFTASRGNITTIKDGNKTVSNQWKPDAAPVASVEFTCGATSRIGKITVTLIPIAAPTLTIDGEEYTETSYTGSTNNGKVTAKLSADEGFSIYYKLDKTTASNYDTADEEFTLYTAEIEVSSEQTLSYYALNPETGTRSETRSVAFHISTGIDDIDADAANAPAEYVNLQGVRIDNPTNGLYIRRQGNNVEKVIIR